jgi:hypothetical protein
MSRQLAECPQQMSRHHTIPVLTCYMLLLAFVVQGLPSEVARRHAAAAGRGLWAWLQHQKARLQPVVPHGS